MSQETNWGSMRGIKMSYDEQKEETQDPKLNFYSMNYDSDSNYDAIQDSGLVETTPYIMNQV